MQKNVGGVNKPKQVPRTVKEYIQKGTEKKSFKHTQVIFEIGINVLIKPGKFEAKTRRWHS